MEIFRRRVLSSAIIWIELLMAVTATQVYEEITPQTLDDEIMYQMADNLDPGLWIDDRKSLNTHRSVDVSVNPIAKDLLLQKILNALSKQNYGQYRPIKGVDFIDYAQPQLSEMKEAVAKRRLSDKEKETTVILKPVSLVRQQPKWKAKKQTRLGAHMMCYFKLCTLRPAF